MIEQQYHTRHAGSGWGRPDCHAQTAARLAESCLSGDAPRPMCAGYRVAATSLPAEY